MNSVLLAALLTAQTAPYDLVIRNGRVIDGTGKPAFQAEIGIRNGRVVAVGPKLGKSKAGLDAQGMVVAPGFIDVHSHGENVQEKRDAQNYLRMGVTTIVIGNCGSSERDLGAFFQKIDRKVGVNVASLVGHNTVRSAGMGGSFDRPPTPEELEKMKAMVGQAMRDGACGLSTGLIYLPGTFAKTDEIVELAKVAAKYNGIYASHMRNESDEVVQALEETFRIGREANIPVQVSHLKVGKAGWGAAPKVLETLAAAQAEGLRVTQDQYMYTASSTTLAQVIPSWAREGGRTKFRERLADPELKAKMIAEMKENLVKRNDEDYSYAVVANYSRDRSLNGLRVPEATLKKKGTRDLDAQIELLLEIEASGGASGVFHGMQEEDLVSFLKHPNTMIAADGSVKEHDADVPHPRSYGNNARFLSKYVREQQVMGLEEGVRRMTSLPARTFKLRDRGVIAKGAWADLVIFDPKMVAEKSTYTKPHQYAAGFRYVFVNGTAVIKNGSWAGKRPGMALRHRP